MPLIEDLLLRFRRIWTPPGAVIGQAGVPEEAGAGLEVEIRELTSALAEIDDDGDALVRAAEREAATVLDLADAESAHEIEAARARLPSVRAQSAAERARDRQTAIDQVVVDAEKAAAEVRANAAARIPAMAARIAGEVFATSMAEEDSARVVGGG